MYLEFYKLREFPFAIGCNERFFFESAIHTEALANMLYTIQQRKGMVLVTGEVGAGKTFVGNIMSSRLGPSCTTVMLKNPPQSGKQLIRAVGKGIGLNMPPNADKMDITSDLETDLIRLHGRDRLVALIIDECQDLTADSLEELRLMWNWEQNGQRLIQILLIGQPEMREKLLEPKWESLRQRIILSYHLSHLSAVDTCGYIHHRLRIAAADNGPQIDFTPEAMMDIYAATNGIPRLINVLCDNALLVGYAKGARCLDRSIVAEVLGSMTCWGLKSSQPIATTVGAAL